MLENMQLQDNSGPKKKKDTNKMMMGKSIELVYLPAQLARFEYDTAIHVIFSLQVED